MKKDAPRYGLSSNLLLQDELEWNCYKMSQWCETGLEFGVLEFAALDNDIHYAGFKLKPPSAQGWRVGESGLRRGNWSIIVSNARNSIFVNEKCHS